MVLSALIIIGVITILHKCLKDKRHDVKIKTKYYTPQLHAGAFALPAYVTEALEDVE